MKSCWKFAIEAFFAGKNAEIVKPMDKARYMERLCYGSTASMLQLRPESQQPSERPKKPMQNGQLKIIVGMMEIFAKQFSERKERIKDFEKKIR